MQQTAYYPPVQNIIDARYDDRRFPKKWQAMAGVASMDVVTIVFYFLTGIPFLGHLPFRTDFGYNMFLTALTQFFGVLIIPLFILFIAKKDVVTTVRLRKTLDAAQVAMLVGISVGVFFAAQIANNLFVEQISGVIGQPADSGLDDMLSAQTPAQLLFEIVVVAGLPAICEELFFRGLVMRAFERKSPVAAVMLSSLVFAVMHGNVEQFAYTFLIGVLLAVVTITTDSLLAGTVVHFTLNAISTILVYPAVSPYLDALDDNLLLLLGITFALLCAGGALLLVLILYTRKKNVRLYDKPFVSDLRYPRLMPRQATGEKVAYILCWVGFVLQNVFNMVVNWT